VWHTSEQSYGTILFSEATIAGNTYLDVVENCAFPYLEEDKVGIFQQYGALPRYSSIDHDALIERFLDIG
jgi:hypothetical protein